LRIIPTRCFFGGSDWRTLPPPPSEFRRSCIRRPLCVGPPFPLFKTRDHEFPTPPPPLLFKRIKCRAGFSSFSIFMLFFCCCALCFKGFPFPFDSGFFRGRRIGSIRVWCSTSYLFHLMVRKIEGINFAVVLWVFASSVLFPPHLSSFPESGYAPSQILHLPLRPFFFFFFVRRDPTRYSVGMSSFCGAASNPCVWKEFVAPSLLSFF